LLGLEEMTQPKLVNWDLMPPKRNMWWFPFDRETYEGLLAGLKANYPKSPAELGQSMNTLSRFAVKKMFTAWKP
jgi:succinate-semialdehyde dehydrogenase/glutarate-semialdehyde dehydrogenase